MTASKTMAKRAAAGTLALAVCLTGGLVSAGAANAALPTAGGLVRPMPTADPSATSGNVDAPVVTTGSTGVKLKDFQVVLPNTWAAGDRVAVNLPAGVKFSSTPTFTVSGNETDAVADLATEATPDTAIPTGATAPLFAAATIPTVGSPGIADPNQALIQFTNASTGAATLTDWVLTVSGVTVDIPKDAGLTGDALTVKVTGYNAAGSPTTYTESDTFDDAITTLAYISPITFSLPANQSLIPGGGPQTIGDVTLSEVIPEGLANGSYTLSFDQDGTAVAVDPTLEDNDSAAFDIDVTGDAELDDAVPATAAGGSVSFSVTGLETTAASALETFVVKNLRISPVSSSPITVTLTATPDAAFNSGFVAVNGTATVGTPENESFSRVDSEDGVEAAQAIGIVPQGDRIGGNDRYETAAQIALQVATPATDNIIIASGEPGSSGVDALSANYLAGTFDAPTPVLLTQQAKLPDSTLVAVRTLLTGVGNNGTANIYVVGGATAVSDAVLTELRDAFASDFQNLTVQRVAGDDRFATAASVATLRGQAPVGSFVGTFGKGSAKTAFLTNGNAPADALAAGPIAYANGFPLLQSQATSIPQSTLVAIDSLGIKQVVVVGGTTVVSESVVSQLTALGINVVRVAGEDRYATTAALNTFAEDDVASVSNTTGGLNYEDPTVPLIANGVGFADALVSGPLAGAVTRTIPGFNQYNLTAAGAAGGAAPGAPATITEAQYLLLPTTTTAATTEQGDYAVQAVAPVVVSTPQPLLLTQPTQLSAATGTFISDNADSITNVQGVGLSAALPQSVLIEANRLAAN